MLTMTPSSSASDDDTPRDDASAGTPSADAEAASCASQDLEPAAPRARRIRASDSDRDDVLTVLSQAHTNGRLDAQELDERQTEALRARFIDELPELIEDLPEGRELVAAHRALIGEPTTPAQPGSTVARVSRPAAGPLAVEHVETSPSIAFMGGKTIAARPGESDRQVYAVMGGDEIYLTDAMGPGVEYRIHATSVMGGCDIYVPPGVRIVDNAVNILGGNDIKPQAQGDGSNGTLYLHGVNFMAGCDVKLDKTAPALPHNPQSPR